MRDITHNEQIIRWANHVKNNPDKWKSKIKDFIDSQIIISNRFYKNLSRTKRGKEKIRLLKNLKNESKDKS